MPKKRWQVLCLALLTHCVVYCTSTQARELNNNYNEEILGQIDRYTQTDDSIAQVNSVSQLRDVAPTDWAYEALRSLVERYGCIVGYPDRTFIPICVQKRNFDKILICKFSS